MRAAAASASESTSERQFRVVASPLVHGSEWVAHTDVHEVPVPVPLKKPGPAGGEDGGGTAGGGRHASYSDFWEQWM